MRLLKGGRAARITLRPIFTIHQYRSGSPGSPNPHSLHTETRRGLFSLKLTRVIEPKEGPGVELATLEDAARFMGTCGRPHWEYAAELMLIAATAGEEADIERATAQMERALA